MKKIFALFLLANLCTGCVHYKYDMSQSTAKTDKYEVSISMAETPVRPKAWITAPNAYKLSTYNRTNDDIEIDWTKTSFIVSGQTKGGFMKSGELYMNRDLPKNPTIVLPMASQTIKIYPAALIDDTQYQAEIPNGKNGIYLVLKVGNEEYKEQLYITKTME